MVNGESIARVLDLPNMISAPGFQSFVLGFHGVHAITTESMATPEHRLVRFMGEVSTLTDVYLKFALLLNPIDDLI
jgi:hypothetical protein